MLFLFFATNSSNSRFCCNNEISGFANEINRGNHFSEKVISDDSYDVIIEKTTLDELINELNNE